jgi:molecular chaperone GrpE
MEDIKKEEKINQDEKLQNELEEKKKELASMIDQAQRIKAEFDNYRKRIEKEKREFVDFGRDEILLALIPIAFNLEQAISEIKNSDVISHGIKLILKDIEKIFDKHHLKRKKVIGEKFDPNFHEAVMTEQDNEKDDNIIIRELSSCYLKTDKVFTHAKVVISKKIENTSKEEETIN